MIEMYQNTIKNPISCFGKGLHTGASVSMVLKPAPEDTGILFIRTDLNDSSAMVQASYEKVEGTMLGTSIYNDSKVSISTIEHLTSALWGLNIDNIIIEINGPEVPIMDGSSADFIFILECAGIERQNKLKNFRKILNNVKVEKDNAYIQISPSEHFQINLEIDFPSKAIGVQKFSFNLDRYSFAKHIANARTFGFLADVDKLHKAGLAKGASLDNAIVIDENDQVVNENGLRYNDEFVRHKVLDCIGDLYLGGLLQGKVEAYCSGHHLNNSLLREIFNNSNNSVLLQSDNLHSARSLV